MARPSETEVRTAGRASTVILAVIAVLTLPVAPVATQGTAAPAPHLPSPRAFTSAVWDGTQAVVFGGEDDQGPLDEVVTVDPGTGQVTTRKATLPSPRSGTSAVFDGEHAYVYGGKTSDGDLLDEVVRYDPDTGTVTVLPETLADGRAYSTAVWTGDNALIFGGHSADGQAGSRNILIHDPGTGTVTTAEARLPVYPSAWEEWEGTVAAWDGQHAYVAVNYDCSAWCGNGNFHRYDPRNDRIERTGLELERGHADAVTGEKLTYVPGGMHRGGETDRIWAYDLARGESVPMTIELPDRVRGASTVWTGDDVIAFGGHIDGPFWQPGRYHDDITVVTPGPPGPMAELTARPGNDPGEVLVRWDPPADTGGFPVDAYRLHRVQDDGTFTLIDRLASWATGYIDTDRQPGQAQAYVVQATTLYAQGPAAPQADAPAREDPQVGGHATVHIALGGAVPDEARIRNGGVVTFAAQASSSPGLDPSDTVGGSCFRFAYDHGHPMNDGQTYDVRLVLDDEEDLVHAATDGDQVLHACPGAASQATDDGALVPFDLDWGSGYGEADGAIRILEPWPTDALTGSGRIVER